MNQNSQQKRANHRIKRDRQGGRKSQGRWKEEHHLDLSHLTKDLVKWGALQELFILALIPQDKDKEPVERLRDSLKSIRDRSNNHLLENIKILVKNKTKMDLNQYLVQIEPPTPVQIISTMDKSIKLPIQERYVAIMNRLKFKGNDEKTKLLNRLENEVIQEVEVVNEILFKLIEEKGRSIKVHADGLFPCIQPKTIGDGSRVTHLVALGGQYFLPYLQRGDLEILKYAYSDQGRARRLVCVNYKPLILFYQQNFFEKKELIDIPDINK